MKTFKLSNMKNLFLVMLLAAFTLSGCSDDDATPVENTCMMKVITLSAGGAPGDPITYSVEYGTSSSDKVSTEISEAVYNYYHDLSMIAPNPRWRGEVTE